MIAMLCAMSATVPTVTLVSAMTQTHHLSQAAHQRLLAEYEDLTTRGRIEIARAIERARELGDLSENGDYHAAKEQQGLMESRIRQLKSILDNVEIVAAGSDGTVGFLTKVGILYEGDSEDMVEYYLVGHPEERHPELQTISPGSPLGTALMGADVDTVVSFNAGRGDVHVRVVSVEQIRHDEHDGGAS
jgi:transcription elongation factor GreA